MLRVEGDQDTVFADGSGDVLEHGREGSSADDDLSGTLLDEGDRALWRANAAANATLGATGEEFNDSVIGTAAHSCIEVDDLNFGEASEALQHDEGSVAFEGFFAALDELNDFAVLEVDTGDDHAFFLTGMLCWARKLLRSLTV